jgi:hypothetical protein
MVEKDGLLMSKWGGNELIEDGVWEVPTYYGDEYKVLSRPIPTGRGSCLRTGSRAQHNQFVTSGAVMLKWAFGLGLTPAEMLAASAYADRKKEPPRHQRRSQMRTALRPRTV